MGSLNDPAAELSDNIGRFVHNDLGINGKRAGATVAGALLGAVLSITHAATASVIDGNNFGDALVQSIPDVVGDVLQGYISACFTGETLVQTVDGLKRIDEIKVGDWVFSKDDKFNNPDLHRRQVTKLFSFEDKATMDVSIQNEAGHQVTLRTTPEHPFVVEGIGWVSAGDLEIGHRTVEMTGKLGTLTKILRAPLQRGLHLERR